MTQPLNDLERRLAEALHQEASLAMTMTDTPRELRRWHDNQKNRRTRMRVAAGVAAAAVVVGVIIGATVVSRHSHQPVPAHKNPKPTAPRSSTLGLLPPLPATTHVTYVNGPTNVGRAVSFGAVWATGFGATSGHLYRLDPATGAVLSDTTYAGPVGDGQPPFRVGQVMLLPSAPANGPKGYLVYTSDGRPTGRIVAASMPGIGDGDASGGWVQLALDRLGRVDASGHLVRSVPAPGPEVTAIGVGPAGVWIGLIGDNDLFRLDPSTGATIGRVRVAPSPVSNAVGVNTANPVQILSTPAGVFDATSGNQIVHVDANGTVLAVSTNHMTFKSWSAITMGPDGNLWASPDQGGVVALNPRTLALVRGWQVFPDARQGGVSGLVVTAHQVFLGDVDRTRTATFPSP